MKSSEEHVVNYLKTLGFETIVYEPNGKDKPPDFAINGRIAVEVRRLNQNYLSGTQYEGLEVLDFSLMHRIENLLVSFGPPVGGNSWFIMNTFRRPLEPWSVIGPRLKLALENFAMSHQKENTRIKLVKNFELEFLQASRRLDFLFVLGSPDDDDAGWWLLPELYKNLQICVKEKSLKFRKANVFSKYKESWLVFTDHIGLAYDRVTREELRKHEPCVDDWARIVLIHPEKYEIAYEI